MRKLYRPVAGAPPGDFSPAATISPAASRPSWNGSSRGGRPGEAPARRANQVPPEPNVGNLVGCQPAAGGKPGSRTCTNSLSAMPHVTVAEGTAGNPVYQVGSKSFVFFRNPRPDAIDPDTGERYRDIIVFWVPVRGRQAGTGPGPRVTVLHHRRISTAIPRSCCEPPGSAS